jgi:hypothetical protein
MLYCRGTLVTAPGEGHRRTAKILGGKWRGGKALDEETKGVEQWQNGHFMLHGIISLDA